MRFIFYNYQNRHEKQNSDEDNEVLVAIYAFKNYRILLSVIMSDAYNCYLNTYS